MWRAPIATALRDSSPQRAGGFSIHGSRESIANVPALCSGLVGAGGIKIAVSVTLLENADEFGEGGDRQHS